MSERDVISRLTKEEIERDIRALIASRYSIEGAGETYAFDVSLPEVEIPEEAKRFLSPRSIFYAKNRLHSVILNDLEQKISKEQFPWISWFQIVNLKTLILEAKPPVLGPDGRLMDKEEGGQRLRDLAKIHTFAYQARLHMREMLIWLPFWEAFMPVGWRKRWFPEGVPPEEGW